MTLVISYIHYRVKHPPPPPLGRRFGRCQVTTVCEFSSKSSTSSTLIFKVKIRSNRVHGNVHVIISQTVIDKTNIAFATQIVIFLKGFFVRNLSNATIAEIIGMYLSKLLQDSGEIYMGIYVFCRFYSTSTAFSYSCSRLDISTQWTVRFQDISTT